MRVPTVIFIFSALIVTSGGAAPSVAQGFDTGKAQTERVFREHGRKVADGARNTWNKNKQRAKDFAASKAVEQAGKKIAGKAGGIAGQLLYPKRACAPSNTSQCK